MDNVLIRNSIVLGLCQRRYYNDVTIMCISMKSKEVQAVLQET
jgi:hypothetical protein